VQLPYNLKQTKTNNMITIFQIVIDGTATNHTFSREGAISLVEKMVELQEELPKSTITFITITL
tara:strand:+ start:163 stop:354 length:192 start_codon:yes stop_codon:yes gene_type:complete